MRRQLGILTIAAPAVAITACGGDDDSSPSPADDAGESGPIATTRPP